MLKAILFVSGLVLVFCIFQTDAKINCLQCNDVANISECLDNRVTCGDGEECFLEEVTTDTNQRVLNGGCRSNGVCKVMAALSSVGKRDLDRKQRSIVICARCCNTAADADGPCNAKLCGQRPSSNRPPRCLSCIDKASAGACSTRQACQETQVCGNEILVKGGSIVRYNFYCEEKHLCETAYEGIANLPPSVISGRKRASGHSTGVPICNSCCIGDECNRVDCYQLQKNYTSGDFTSPPGASSTPITG